MINSANAINSWDLQYVLEKQGIHVSAIEGSGVHAAMCQLVGVNSIPSAKALTLVSQNLNAQTNDPGLYTHIVKGIAKEVASHVADSLSMLRTYVSPFIAGLSTMLQAQLEGLTSFKSIAPKIIELHLPTPLSDPGLFEEIEEKAARDVVRINVTTALPRMIYSEIVQYSLTGGNETDELIRQWYATLDPARVEWIYECMFVTGKDGGINAALQNNDNPDEQMVRAMMAYLLARGLRENIPEGAISTLNDYQQFMDVISMQAARALRVCILVYGEQITNKQILLNLRDESIWVNGVVYDEWVQEGRNADAIYGSSISQTPSYRVEEILEKEAAYTTAWNDYIVLRLSADNAMLQAQIGDMVRSVSVTYVNTNLNMCFLRHAKGAKEITLEQAQTANYYQDFLKRLDQTSRNLGLRKIDAGAMSVVADQIACECIFHDTDAPTLLQGCDEAISVNKNLTLNQAMLMSAFDLITKSVASQLVTYTT